MKSLKHAFANLEEYVLTVLMAAIAIVIFVQVVFRQIGGSLPWSEETSRYLLVWITFIGSSLGVKRGAHVGVEAFLLLFPIKVRKAISLLSIALAVFFCAIVFVFSLQIISTQMSTNQISPAMRIPMWWAYAALPVGMALIIIRFIQVAVKTVKTFGDDSIIVTGLEGDA